MADRTLPPSPRRLALARRAGLTAASPVAVTAIASLAAVIGLAALGRALGGRIAEWIRAACSGDATLAATDVAASIIALVLPLAALIACAALVAQLAQTRTPWLPRRRIAGAPVAEPRRARRASHELGNALVLAGVAFGWLWFVAPRLAALFAVDALLPAAAALLLALVATLVIAMIALAALDILVRRAGLAHDLAMSHGDKRADDRLAAADPRWRARRAAALRGSGDLDAAVAGASLLVLGDDVAIAIAWHPTLRPIPTRTASGRGTRATQLLGLARRHHVPIHRDPTLTAALFGTGPIDERDWPRVAELVAATTRP